MTIEEHEARSCWIARGILLLIILSLILGSAANALLIIL